MVRYGVSKITGEFAVCGDWKVSRGLFGNRCTVHRFQTWEHHPDGSRTGVWELVPAP